MAQKSAVLTLEGRFENLNIELWVSFNVLTYVDDVVGILIRLCAGQSGCTILAVPTCFCLL